MSSESIVSRRRLDETDRPWHSGARAESNGHEAVTRRATRASRSIATVEAKALKTLGEMAGRRPCPTGQVSGGGGRETTPSRETRAWGVLFRRESPPDNSVPTRGIVRTLRSQTHAVNTQVAHTSTRAGNWTRLRGNGPAKVTRASSRATSYTILNRHAKRVLNQNSEYNSAK